MNRERQARWDGKNMVVLSTKLRTKDAAEIDMLCRQEGRTIYAVLQELLADWKARKRGRTERPKQTFDCYRH